MCSSTVYSMLLKQYKVGLRNHILQDIEVAEEVLAELGYTKEKPPTPAKESRVAHLCWECGSSSHSYCDRY